MENQGLVRDMLDLKVLILYVLRRLPAPIDSEQLFEVCLCDNGVGYFDYSQCLSELVETGNVEETEEEYRITEKGIRNADAVCTSLPFSVRSAADRKIAPASEMLKRYNLIKTEQSEENGMCTVHLALSDGECSLMDLKLFCGSEDDARSIKRNFRKNAEKYYQRLIGILTGSEAE